MKRGAIMKRKNYNKEIPKTIQKFIEMFSKKRIELMEKSCPLYSRKFRQWAP